MGGHLCIRCSFPFGIKPSGLDVPLQRAFHTLNAELESLQERINTLQQEIAQLQILKNYQMQLAFTQMRTAQDRMAIMGSAALSLSSFNMSGTGFRTLTRR